MIEKSNLKTFFLRLVKSKGGFVCHHAHLDKAYLVTPYNLRLSQNSLQEKWNIYRELKFRYTENSLVSRMEMGIASLKEQGVTKCRTFIDADPIVGLTPMKVAQKLKEKHAKEGFDLQLAVQPLEGVVQPEARRIFTEACEIADVVGGLPDRDESPSLHMDIILSIAKEMSKPVDVHVGQNNIPSEKESEMVADKVSEYGLEGEVNLVHAISLACQQKSDRERVISKIRDAGIGVIVCPSAALSMKQQSDLTAPIHNSIAPVMELIEGGVDVMLGVDNIADLFMPLVDGDLWFESRILMEAIRCYDLELISNIVSNPRGFSTT
jgi:cytosine/adenosine deaminase-related metal-dependent hydrolase